MKHYTTYKVFASNAAPSEHIGYWADLTEDPSGSVIKVYDNNSDKWVRITRPVATSSSNPDVTIPEQYYTNNAGQVKVNYTNFGITGFQSAVSKRFPLHLAIPTLSESPITKWPINSIKGYAGGLYEQGNDPENTGRLRENPIQGQVHRWRIIGSYANKTIGNTMSLQIRLYNPDSGFSAVGKNYLPATVQQGDFAFEISTVADNSSLGAGRGYVLDAKVSTDDPTLELTISSILRISEATELTPIE